MFERTICWTTPERGPRGEKGFMKRIISCHTKLLSELGTQHHCRCRIASPCYGAFVRLFPPLICGGNDSLGADGAQNLFLFRNRVSLDPPVAYIQPRYSTVYDSSKAPGFMWCRRVAIYHAKKSGHQVAVSILTPSITRQSVFFVTPYLDSASANVRTLCSPKYHLPVAENGR